MPRRGAGKMGVLQIEKGLIAFELVGMIADERIRTLDGGRVDPVGDDEFIALDLLYGNRRIRLAETFAPRGVRLGVDGLTVELLLCQLEIGSGLSAHIVIAAEEYLGDGPTVGILVAGENLVPGRGGILKFADSSGMGDIPGHHHRVDILIAEIFQRAGEFLRRIPVIKNVNIRQKTETERRRRLYGRHS